MKNWHIALLALAFSSGLFNFGYFLNQIQLEGFAAFNLGLLIILVNITAIAFILLFMFTTVLTILEALHPKNL